MELETKLAEYASEAKFENLPKEPVDVAKNMVLTILGTTIAGATAEGCETLVNQAKEWGGREEATILIYGGRVPAYNAALVNSVMARSLDFCDGMMPGMHLGSASVPTALATAELIDGCSGKDFLSALVIGSEIAARLNLSESAYDGFDPSGVCSVFATTVVAGRMLRLNSAQMLNALALAFNRSGGSFQSHIDGSQAAILIQGFVSQAGIICAQLALKGFSGPKNFLEGACGYFHVYGKDKYNAQAVVGELGERFEMTKIVFKKYPSCGCTFSSNDAILELLQEKELTPENVIEIHIKVTPHIYKLVGHPFKIGQNPKIDAQYSIQYCVANALLRKSVKLKHFDETYVKDPKIMDLVKKIHITEDPLLNERGHTALDMRITTEDGHVYHQSVDIASGFPGNLLSKEEHNERFQDCVNYQEKPLTGENIEKTVSRVGRLEEAEDVCSLIPLLLR